MLHSSMSRHKPSMALSSQLRLPGCHAQFLLCPRGARAVVRYRPDEAPAQVNKARSVTDELERKLEAQRELLGDKRQQVEEMLATLRTLADEAASLQDKLSTTLTSGATGELANTTSNGLSVQDNVASARAWIEAWRAKQPVGQVDGTPAASQQAQDAPENVASARAWIAAWRAQQPPSSLPTASSATGPSPAAAATPAAPAKGAAPAGKAAQATASSTNANRYTNTNRFWVPQHLVARFLRTIAARQADMEAAEGFAGFVVRPPAGSAPGAEVVYEVSSSWASVPAWEAWSLGRGHVRNQLPTGVFQYVPGKGQGFPEDFVPFKDLADVVPNARY